MNKENQTEWWVMRVFVGSLAMICLASGAFGQSKGVVAECKLLEQAYRATKAATGAARSDILTGCPNYENWPETMNRRENAKAFRAARKAKLPSGVKGGKPAKMLLQRMVARGVPVEIATQMATKPAFAKAVAAFGK